MLTTYQLRAISQLQIIAGQIANDVKKFNRMALDSEIEVKLNVDAIRAKYKTLNKMVTSHVKEMAEREKGHILADEKRVFRDSKGATP